MVKTWWIRGKWMPVAVAREPRTEFGVNNYRTTTFTLIIKVVEHGWS